MNKIQRELDNCNWLCPAAEQFFARGSLYDAYDIAVEIVEAVSHSTPQCTLETFMEGMVDGFSVVSADADMESFTHSTLQLDDAWTAEASGQRYADSTYYPFGPTYPHILAEAIQASHRSPHAIMMSHLASAVSFKLTDGIPTSEQMSVLDTAMIECNQVYADMLKDLPPGAPPTETGIDIQCIRDAYLMYVDYLQSAGDCKYFCNTGNNPIIFDQMYDWSAHHESGGGWNRLDPTSEEDWCMRNELDVCDIPTQIRTADRSCMYTTYIAWAKHSREVWLEAYTNILKATRTQHHAHVTMLKIEIAYKRSLVACESRSNLTDIHITRKQLMELRVVYQAQLSVLIPQIQRRTLYLGYAIALHQCDCKQGEIKASTRLLSTFKGIKVGLVGCKYYNRLKVLKDKMFDYLCRNLPGYVSKNVPAPTNLPKCGTLVVTLTYEPYEDCYPQDLTD